MNLATDILATDMTTTTLANNRTSKQQFGTHLHFLFAKSRYFEDFFEVCRFARLIQTSSK
jgi:hypothetical protein